MNKNVLRISRKSVRIPVLLLLSETAIFVAAVLIAAFLGFGDGGLDPASPWLIVQALLFTAVMMVCMLVMGLYRGRPKEGVTLGFLRLGLALILGVVLLQGVFQVLPGLRVAVSSLVLASVLAFFFLGTIRPIFFDTVRTRRGRRQPESQQPGPNGTGPVEQAPAPSNTGETSLTGQHRSSGRWL